MERSKLKSKSFVEYAIKDSPRQKVWNLILRPMQNRRHLNAAFVGNSFLTELIMVCTFGSCTRRENRFCAPSVARASLGMITCWYTCGGTRELNRTNVNSVRKRFHERRIWGWDANKVLHNVVNWFSFHNTGSREVSYQRKNSPLYYLR